MASLRKKNDRRLFQVLRNWMFNEVLPQSVTDHMGTDGDAAKHVLRRLFREAIVDAARGEQLPETFVEDMVKREIAKAIGLYVPYKGTPKEGAALFTKKIHELVEAEVRKQVAEALCFDIGVKGRVFVPPAGQRRVDVSHDEDLSG